MFVRITVNYSARGITSTLVIAIGTRLVYNVIYKGDNKCIVQKKKFQLFLNIFFFTKKHVWHEQDNV